MYDHDDFNLLLARIISRLYKSHPKAIALGSDELWEPPLRSTDEGYADNTAVSGGTIKWLYRNGFVQGTLHESQSGSCYIAQAQLSSLGYRIATGAEPNAGGIPLGQVAVEAATDPASHSTEIALVARRFVDG